MLARNLLARHIASITTTAAAFGLDVLPDPDGNSCRLALDVISKWDAPNNKDCHVPPMRYEVRAFFIAAVPADVPAARAGHPPFALVGSVLQSCGWTAEDVEAVCSQALYHLDQMARNSRSARRRRGLAPLCTPLTA